MAGIENHRIEKIEASYANPVVLFITGLPCTGKTVLGKQIAAHFSLPYLYKDGIKESLFDSLGWSDRNWSKRVGAAAYSLLFSFTEALLEARLSFILESNFSVEREGPRLQELQENYQFRAIEIQCVAKGEVIVERYRQRWEAGTRHPGHVDPETYDEMHPTLLLGRLPPLGLQGEYIEVETTDFEKVDVTAVIQVLERKLERTANHSVG
jgi:predicted kinase